MIPALRSDLSTAWTDDPRVDEILAELLELPPEERLARLDERCRDQPRLKAAVEGLLDPDSAWMTELETPALEHWSRWQAEEPVGEELGDYRLERLLGTGGTSSVYLGRRLCGVGPERVAIKKMTTPLAGSAEARHRFAREAEILARLSHPNIATIHGGGMAADGSPYLVLEYVEGTPVDRWCAEEGLSIRERLRLFIEICDAVSFAHGQLIVHRDLKPANILVDGEGRARLLDFGIAKWLESVEGEAATATAFRMLTPEYASPEQLRFQGTTVATDVYALGVVLFELLAGRRPFRRQGDTQALYRAILEEPAPKMSWTAKQDDGRGGERWSRQLEGDLDAIVDRCLAKAPAERYASPRELADDIERHLRRLPVRARSQTPLYRWARLVRRRWRESIFALTILGFLGMRSLDAESLRQERDRATATRDFLLEVLREASPSQSRGDELSLREILDQSVNRLDRFADQPGLERFFLHFYGDVYNALGEHGRAEDLLVRALAIVEPGEVQARTEVLTSMGLLRRNQGDPISAETLLEEALGAESVLEADAVLHFQTLQNLGLSLSDQGRYREAEEHLRGALELAWSRGLPMADQALGYNNLGYCLYGQGRPREALFYFRRSTELRRQALGPRHPDYAIAVNNAAAVALSIGRLDEARSGLEEALAVWKDRDPEHPTVGVLASNLGAVQQQQGDFEAAERSFTEALELQIRQYGRDHPEAAVSANNLGNLLADQGRPEEARPYLEDSHRVMVATRGERHPDTLATLWNLVETEIDAGAPRAVEGGMGEVLEAHLDALAADPEARPSQVRHGAKVLAHLFRSHGQERRAERLEARFEAQSADGSEPGS